MNGQPRLMIAAAHKSSGKTVISTGLVAALRQAGDEGSTFKKGPDYIDPMWLSAASAVPCYNLDFHAMGRETIPEFSPRTPKSCRWSRPTKVCMTGCKPMVRQQRIPCQVTEFAGNSGDRHHGHDPWHRAVVAGLPSV